MSFRSIFILLAGLLSLSACVQEQESEPLGSVQLAAGSRPDGARCRRNNQCASGLCLFRICQPNPLSVCGDGVVQAGEGCDDGNQSNTDACPDGPGGSCQAASCGDGFVHSGTEACDGDGNGNGGETSSCDSDCTVASCGDGMVNASAGESCDDGNQSNQDTCADGPGGSCQASSCSDGLTSGNETDVDCGGSCTSCSNGSSCMVASDCASGVCSGGTCQSGQCGDGVVQAGEGCDDGNQSNADACPDGPGGSCQAASCGDGFVHIGNETCDGDGNGNGGETSSCDSDCTAASCGDGTVNVSAGESCDDGNFSNQDMCPDGFGGHCQAATCSDGLTSGDETDVDCGGSSCLACETGEACLLAADCLSGMCSGGLCQAVSCSDGIANGDESDIDCGGSSCGGCVNGSSCTVASDCASGVCSAGSCQGTGTDLSDDFDGDGSLLGWMTHYRDVDNGATNPLPDVTRTNGRYRANLTNNASNQTLFYHQDEGRLDYKAVKFPFTVIARNVGIGTQGDSQTAPAPPPAPQESYIFSGVQVHVPEFYDSVLDGSDYAKISSAHAVVGHRGLSTYTLEGKTTLNGFSFTSDAGSGIAPSGRLDLRIIGKADFTLEVSWQQPNPNPGVQPDNWSLYLGTGELPGTLPNFGDPAYGGMAYVGFVTYAFYSQSVPFVGTCDAIEIVEEGESCQGGCCSDGVQNGDETDVDCGGANCSPCSDGAACALNSDCSSDLCNGGFCQSGQCGDGVVQFVAGESCDDGNSSNNDSCLNNCQLASCGDGFVHNQAGGSESCDGDGNGNGGETAGCDSDCTPASCGDGTLNASAGESCDDGNLSNQDACTDGLGGSCQFASCSDGLTSGDESDVDCGGSSCVPCALGSACYANSDCDSYLCSGGVCQASLSDDFAGDGSLLGWMMHYRDIDNGAANPLPDVTRSNGRYRASVTNNANNQTLFYHQDEGRLDYKPVSFPFTVIARNIGIGTQSDSQLAPAPPSAPQEAYIFSGVQIHVPEFYDSVIDGGDYTKVSSAHAVVGHRGLATYTLEGKTTFNGVSYTNDAGQGIAPNGRLDLRIVGKADFTLEVSWQQPNPNPGVQPDNWILYRGTGALPGILPNFADPAYGGVAYVGFITYAFYSQLVPFVGTCDAIEIIEQ